MGPLHWVVLLSALQAAQPTLVTGTLKDPVLDDRTYSYTELKLSDDRDLPGVTAGDRVFRGNTMHFRSDAGAVGLAVAFVETDAGAYLFVDANRDGRLTESERTPYTPASNYPAAREVVLKIASGRPGLLLPFRCRVVSDEGPRRSFQYNPTYRVEGSVDIGGKSTLVWLPFDAGRGTIDTQRGFFGIDTDGDGVIYVGPGLGPSGGRRSEGIWMNADRVVVRVRDKYVSLESADLASHTLVLREHAAEEYRIIEIAAGAPLPDFSFTDFAGAARKLSDFKGQYLLLEFWGTWCGPCVAELPELRAARDRFRERGFEVLGMDREFSATSEAVRQLLVEKGVTWPNATPDSVKDLIDNRYRIDTFPTLILLDPDGIVVEIGGHMHNMLPRLEQLLEKRK
jgi:thiol-disulfide isomerase/thioredoxin